MQIDAVLSCKVRIPLPPKLVWIWRFSLSSLLTRNVIKPFADDKSLFTVVQETNAAFEDMNHDL